MRTGIVEHEFAGDKEADLRLERGDEVVIVVTTNSI